ncbi:hypothetical protein B4U80_01109 [Leptotrombidium deliense]|uniref:Uncharacterized protein n=1 Tax=Leptotrombidium deliense TaxID=299467 RepID=A0A443RWT7_9ACAR|nr:hypothetical protein B4U80_01109 [Leptotrombidium deliense]
MKSRAAFVEKVFATAFRIVVVTRPVDAIIGE